jgi:hypothetical protein
MAAGGMDVDGCEGHGGWMDVVVFPHLVPARWSAG